MSKIFTQTLNSQNDFISLQHATTTVYSTSFLQQGGLSSYEKGNYVGIMRFSNLPNCTSLIIKTIKFNFSFEQSDYSKNLVFYDCTLLKGEDNTKTGENYLKNQLGAITVSSGGQKEIILSKDSNSTLFNNLVNYLKSSNEIENICLYDSTATRLFKIISATITIEYDTGIIYYGIAGDWKPCLVYYGTSSGWRQVSLYYGTNGTWKQIG